MRRISMALGIALALFAAACGDSTEPTTTPNTVGSGATTSSVTTTVPDDRCTADRVGGSITFGDFRAPSALDPQSPNSAAGVVGGAAMAAIFDVLVRYDQASGTFVPQVAESFSSNADATAWTVKLRSGVKFGNGDPLDATAVKASVQRMRDPKTKSARAGLANLIADIATPDPQTVVFTLSAPWGGFPYFLAGEGGMIVNARVATELGDKFTTMPIGGGVGPYEPTKFAPGEEIVLKAKSTYWGGPVCISELHFVQLNGGLATYEAIKNGTLHAGLVREFPVIAQAQRDNATLSVDSFGLGTELFINQRPNAPGSDLRLRQAIAYALDATQIDQRVNNGEGDPSKAIVTKKSRLFQSLDGLAADPSKAKELVAQLKADGKLTAPLKLVAQNSPAGQNSALAVQTQLQAVGIEVTVDLQATQQAAVIGGNFDITLSASNLSDAGPYVALSRYTSTAPNNYVAFKNADYDAAVGLLRVARDSSAIATALRKVQDVWNATIPTVPLGGQSQAIVLASNIRGVRTTSETVALFDRAYLAKR